jgi:hypothetical protein
MATKITGKTNSFAERYKKSQARFNSKCHQCGDGLPEGTNTYYRKARRTMICEGCHTEMMDTYSTTGKNTVERRNVVVEAVPCRSCEAHKGNRCVSDDGAERESNHIGRYVDCLEHLVGM